jgi:hypothetical protein
VPAPDEDVESAPRVLPLAPIQVVTQPGAVKLVHRSGRVLHAFTGATMKADGLLLAAELLRVLGDDGLLAREVEMLKPWWRRLWPW